MYLLNGMRTVPTLVYKTVSLIPFAAFLHHFLLIEMPSIIALIVSLLSISQLATAQSAVWDQCMRIKQPAF